VQAGDLASGGQGGNAVFESDLLACGHLVNLNSTVNSIVQTVCTCQQLKQVIFEHRRRQLGECPCQRETLVPAAWGVR
jgi:hypothetical protein